MAYTINLTNGTIFATIPDGTINTTSSMTLIGKNYAGYGQFLDDNFIHLLENSSNTTAPSTPLTGQLWWDSTNKLLKAYNATGWKSLGFLATSNTAPTNTSYGDLWYDNANDQLNVYTIGNAWLTVGPAYSSTQGKSGSFGITATDAGTNTYYVTGIYSGGSLVGVASDNADFVPASPAELVSAFAVVYNGYTTYTSGRLAGNVVNNGNVYISAGNASVANATVIVTSTGANVTGTISASGNVTTAGYFIGNLLPPAGSTVSTTGNITGGNIIATTSMYAPEIAHTGSNGVGNIGSSSSYFNQVFATATTALYADVAERFAADSYLEAGTVVELGGAAEITKSQRELSDEVFGVISTRAAYLMNGAAGEDATHPPVAMTGRVPVQVTGAVKKGDRLVRLGNGIARSARPGEATAFNTIGRALESKSTSEVGLVEAIVTIK